MTDIAIPAGSRLKQDLYRTPDRIDIWTVLLETTPEIVDSLRRTLSDDERQRALRFHAVENKNLFIAARGVLRELVSAYVLMEPVTLIFESGVKGKPRLGNQIGLHFNLAHSGRRAIYAIATDDVGVDIECIKPLHDWQKISRRFFTNRETDELMKLDPSHQMAGFFACWTRKEAFLKATGEGIAAGLDKFYAGANPEKTEGAIEQDGETSKWYFKDLQAKDSQAEDQFAAAVVTKFSNPHIRHRNFEQIENCLRAAQESK